MSANTITQFHRGADPRRPQVPGLVLTDAYAALRRECARWRAVAWASWLLTGIVVLVSLRLIC